MKPGQAVLGEMAAVFDNRGIDVLLWFFFVAVCLERAVASLSRVSPALTRSAVGLKLLSLDFEDVPKSVYPAGPHLWTHNESEVSTHSSTSKEKYTGPLLVGQGSFSSSAPFVGTLHDQFTSNVSAASDIAGCALRASAFYAGVVSTSLEVGASTVNATPIASELRSSRSPSRVTFVDSSFVANGVESEHGSMHVPGAHFLAELQAVSLDLLVVESLARLQDMRFLRRVEARGSTQDVPDETAGEMRQLRPVTIALREDHAGRDFTPPSFAPPVSPVGLVASLRSIRLMFT